MEVLFKMLPFGSLFHVDSDTLTAWWVLGTILVMLISTALLWHRLGKCRKELRTHIGSFNVKLAAKSPLLKDAWGAYAHTMLSSEGERQKTPEHAQDFFNSMAVLPSVMNLRLFMAVPNVLVGFGILGTFVGLTVGVATFDTGSADSIKTSIQRLLSGMGTAFVSSVWGMFLSLVYGFVEKRLFHQTELDFASLANSLDDRFRLTKADALRFSSEDTERVLDKYFSYTTEDGYRVLPASVFRDLRLNASEQTRALKSFSTDLADGIRISTQTIDALGDHISHSVGTSIEQTVAPSIHNLATIAEQLRAEKVESSTNAVERIVDSLRLALNEMIGSFKADLSGNTKAEMEHLASSLSSTVSALNDFPRMVQSMSISIDQSTRNLQQMIQESSSNASTEMASSIALVQEHFKKVVEEMSDAVGRVQAHTEALQSHQESNGNHIERLLASTQDVLADAQSLSSNVAATIGATGTVLKQFTEMSQSLVNAGSSIKSSVDNLANGSATFLTQSKSLAEVNQQTVRSLTDALKTSRDLMDDNAKKVGIIREGLSEVFEQLQEGLSAYQVTTRESLNTYLRDFSDKLVEAAKSVGGAAAELETNIEEMNESFERLLKSLPK